MALILGATLNIIQPFPPLALLVLALTLAGACGLGFAVLYHFQVYNPAWPDAQPYDTLFFAITAIIIVLLNRRWIFRR